MLNANAPSEAKINGGLNHRDKPQLPETTESNQPQKTESKVDSKATEDKVAELKEKADNLEKVALEVAKKSSIRNNKGKVEFADKVQALKLNLDVDARRHLENAVERGIPIGDTTKFLETFYRERIEQIIREAIDESTSDSAKASVEAVARISQAISTSAEGKDDKEGFVKNAVSKIDANAELKDSLIDTAIESLFGERVSVESKNRTAQSLRELSQREEFSEIKLILQTYGIEGLSTLSNEELSTLLRNTLAKRDDEKAKQLLSEITGGDAEEPKLDVFRDFVDQDTAEDEIIMEEEQDILPIKLQELVSESVTDLKNSLERYDRHSIRTRLEAAEKAIDSVLYGVGSYDFFDIKGLDIIFEQLNLVMPEGEVSEGTKRNLEEALFAYEAYKTTLAERNARIMATRKSGYDELRKKLEIQNQSKNEDQRIYLTEFDDLTEGSGGIITDLAISKEISKLDSLEYDEKAELLIAYNDGIIRSLFDRIAKSDNELRERIDQVFLQDDTYDASKVRLNYQGGFPILEFSDLTEMAIVLGVDPDSEDIPLGAAHKTAEVIALYDDKENTKLTEDTRKHEMRHLMFEVEEQRKLRVLETMTAYKILRAFNKKQGGEFTPEDAMNQGNEPVIKNIIRYLEQDFEAVNTQEISPEYQQLFKILKECIVFEGDKGELVSSFNSEEGLLAASFYELGRKYHLEKQEIVRAEIQRNLDYRIELETKVFQQFDADNLLTLGGLGIDAKEFSTYIESDGAKQFDETSVEMLTMMRLLNSLISINPDKISDELKAFWSERIKTHQNINSLATLKFIADLLIADSRYELTMPSGNQSEEALEYYDFVRGKDETFLDKEGNLRQSSRSKSEEEKIRNYIRVRLKEAAIRQGHSDEAIQSEMQRADSVYQEVIDLYLKSLAFEANENEEGEKIVATGNDNWDFNVLPKLRGLTSSYKQWGMIRTEFSDWESPVLGRAFGIGDLVTRLLDEANWPGKDLEEAGLLGTNVVRKINQEGLLPLGLAHSRWGDQLMQAFGLINENDNIWLERIGGDTLTTMEISDMMQVILQGVYEKLVKEVGLNQSQALSYLSQRVGLLFYDGQHADPNGATRALEQVDEFIGSSTYNDKKLKEQMKKNGYSNEEIDKYLMIVNPRQEMNGQKIVKGKDFDIKLGHVTDHIKGEAKKMRVRDIFDKYHKGIVDDLEKAFIEQGRTFDRLSEAIMRRQLEEGGNYTLSDVLALVETLEREDTGLYGDSLEEWKGKRRFIQIEQNGEQFDVDDVRDFIKAFMFVRTRDTLPQGIYGEKEVVTIGGYVYEISKGNMFRDEEHKLQIIQHIQRSTNNVIAVRQELEAKRTNGTITNEERIRLEGMPSIEDIPRFVLNEQFGGQLSIYSMGKLRKDTGEFNSDGTGVDETILQKLETKPNETISYKSFGTALQLKSNVGYGYMNVDAFNGADKHRLTETFGSPVFHSDNHDENNYSLADYRPHIINAVEDVLVERKELLRLYLGHQLLLRQAETFLGKTSKNKEQWVGYASMEQKIRWIWIALTALSAASFLGLLGPGAIVALAPMQAAFLNPYVLAGLLADIFIISDRITQRANVWGARKINAIQAVGKLQEQENAYEQALSNPMYSSTRNNSRLFQMNKAAEDVLKQSKLAVEKIDIQNNRMEQFMKDSYGNVQNVYKA